MKNAFPLPLLLVGKYLAPGSILPQNALVPVRVQSAHASWANLRLGSESLHLESLIPNLLTDSANSTLVYFNTAGSIQSKLRCSVQESRMGVTRKTYVEEVTFDFQFEQG